MARLTVKKMDFSHGKWRILFDGCDFWAGGHPVCFERKRDAMHVLEALLAVCDWERVTEFTVEQQRQLWAIIEKTPHFVGLKQIAERQRNRGSFTR